MAAARVEYDRQGHTAEREIGPTVAVEIGSRHGDRCREEDRSREELPRPLSVEDAGARAVVSHGKVEVPVNVEVGRHHGVRGGADSIGDGEGEGAAAVAEENDDSPVVSAAVRCGEIE